MCPAERRVTVGGFANGFLTPAIWRVPRFHPILWSFGGKSWSSECRCQWREARTSLLQRSMCSCRWIYGHFNWSVLVPIVLKAHIWCELFGFCPLFGFEVISIHLAGVHLQAQVGGFRADVGHGLRFLAEQLVCSPELFWKCCEVFWIHSRFSSPPEGSCVPFSRSACDEARSASFDKLFGRFEVTKRHWNSGWAALALRALNWLWPYNCVCGGFLLWPQ